MSNILSVNGLEKRFPIRGSRDVVNAVIDVSFDVKEGEILALVGESGSGKTTVGRCILRLIDPDAGTINFNGCNILDLNQNQFRSLRSQMQMVFQDPYESLNPRMTIEETIEEPLLLFNTQQKKERQELVYETLNLVKVNPKLCDHYPHQLSAGQQQRVGIARAIILHPKLLVLDEPTSALDISIRAEIVDLIFKLKEELNLSYIFISHDLTAIKYASDQIAVMYLGQIVETGKTDEVFQVQYMPYTHALLSSVLYPDPSQKLLAFFLKGEIPSPINLPHGCHLATRCPLVTPKCNQPIELKEVVQGRFVRCIRVQEEGLNIFDEMQQ